MTRDSADHASARKKWMSLSGQAKSKRTGARGRAGAKSAESAESTPTLVFGIVSAIVLMFVARWFRASSLDDAVAFFYLCPHVGEFVGCHGSAASFPLIPCGT